MATPNTSPHPFAHRSSAISTLERLHKLSIEQEQTLSARGAHFPGGVEKNPTVSFTDQLIALDEDKAKAMYSILRAMGATRVIEAGTSFGVSLIYLLCATLDNTGTYSGNTSRRSDHPALVVGTELEPSKAKQALAHVQEALDGKQPECLQLLEGDLLKTLPDLQLPDNSIDALLMDIWAPVALPTVKILLPKLRSGAVIFIDNSIASASRYTELLEFLRNSQNGFISTTLPFDGGFEMCVYVGAT